LHRRNTGYLPRKDVKEQVVPVKKGISLNIVLEEDAQMLGEVEVVAYGVPVHQNIAQKKYRLPAQKGC